MSSRDEHKFLKIVFSGIIGCYFDVDIISNYIIFNLRAPGDKHNHRGGCKY